MQKDPVNESIIADDEGIAFNREQFGPPKNCPECGRELLKPRAKFRKRLLWLMVALPFYAWAAEALFQYFDFLPAGLEHPDRIKDLLWVLFLIIPTAVVVRLFRKSSRILPYECFGCPWKKDFPIQENRIFDLPDNHSRF